MGSSYSLEHSIHPKTDIHNSLYEELKLPVAPACNMMCNFCSKDSDCICNGNNPDSLSKSMTPRQAVTWAQYSTVNNTKIKVLKISGPGEPLFNTQTFEVLKRLNSELPGYEYVISTNGLLLNEKVQDLIKLNVYQVDVAVNAFFSDTFSKLYSRVIKDKDIISKNTKLAEMLFDSQLEGITKSIENGISVKINTVFLPGVNDRDIRLIALKYQALGVNSMRLISGLAGGKMSKMRVPSISELENLRNELKGIIDDIEICSFAF